MNRLDILLDDSALIKQIQSFLDDEAAADRFSGSVLVADYQHLLITTARGYAIHPNVLPNQPDKI